MFWHWDNTKIPLYIYRVFFGGVVHVHCCHNCFYIDIALYVDMPARHFLFRDVPLCWAICDDITPGLLPYRGVTCTWLTVALLAFHVKQEVRLVSTFSTSLGTGRPHPQSRLYFLCLIRNGSLFMTDPLFLSSYNFFLHIFFTRSLLINLCILWENNIRITI